MSKRLYLRGSMILSTALLVGCAAHTPAPVTGLSKDYNTVDRGSYRGSYYEVEKGDTLYFISYVTDKDVNELIRFNNLTEPYTIYPGQKLKLWVPAYVAPKYGQTVETPATTVVAASTVAVVAPKPTLTTPKESSNNSTQKPAKPAPQVVKKDPVKGIDQSKPKEYVGSKGKENVKTTTSPPPANNQKIAKWQWPTKGRVIKNFSAGEQGNKGIDIAGQRGQPIVSTAGGTVVYSGNALRGYGNLIIVKHNDNYLSAYAHNDRLLVSEGQSVKAGQQIATMGSSGAKTVMLHFEIRYQGKSVNPKRYLP
ncbi:membrane protein [Vibrio vulnificus]|nr:membrane protein [Vibrio vulnificus]